MLLPISCTVVYLLIPTSNHNPEGALLKQNLVVYLLIPTSNHNYISDSVLLITVVYLLIPTSNHNLEPVYKEGWELYIF